MLAIEQIEAWTRRGSRPCLAWIKKVPETNRGHGRGRLDCCASGCHARSGTDSARATDRILLQGLCRGGDRRKRGAGRPRGRHGHGAVDAAASRPDDLRQHATARVIATVTSGTGRQHSSGCRSSECSTGANELTASPPYTRLRRRRDPKKEKLGSPHGEPAVRVRPGDDKNCSGKEREGLRILRSVQSFRQCW
jgi:hypothetical protein